jgi:hypothetical protein
MAWRFAAFAGAPGPGALPLDDALPTGAGYGEPTPVSGFSAVPGGRSGGASTI